MTKARKNPKLKNASPEDDGYPALAKILSSKIRRGFYTPGQKLEGVRKIAEEYSVGRRVADAALDLLVLQGLLRVEPRKGFFVNDDIRPKCNYRLGIFVFGMSPCINGAMLQKLNHEAARHRYDLVYGSDYDESDSLKRWLKRIPEIDGLLIAGYVSEARLKPLAKYKKPYLVIGKYDIDKKHPFEDGDLENVLTDALTEAFKPMRGKKIGTILGDSDSSSDKAVMRSVRQAIVNADGILDEKCLIHADGYVYARTRELMKQLPDVVFAIGTFQVAALRILHENPEIPKPYLIGYDRIDLPDGVDDIFDQYLEMNDIDSIMVERSVKRIIAMIEKD